MQLRTQIANFRNINPDTDNPWIYYVGGKFRIWFTIANIDMLLVVLAL